MKKFMSRAIVFVAVVSAAMALMIPCVAFAQDDFDLRAASALGLLAGNTPDLTLGTQAGDAEAPALDLSSLAVSQAEATEGESVTFSATITDATGVRFVQLELLNVNTGKTSYVAMQRSEGDVWSGTLDVTASTVSGEWRPRCLSVEDVVDNYAYYYDSRGESYGITAAMSAWDFVVIGTAGDAEAPALDLSSLAVSQAEATEGESVTFSATITDATGVRFVQLELLNVNTGKTSYVAMQRSEGDVWSGTLDVTASTVSGEWRPRCLSVEDVVDNYAYYYDSRGESYGITADMSAWDFVIVPLGSYLVTYKDGCNGTAFKEQRHVVESGAATPAFDGQPYREGFIFDGWTPAVAETVSDNVTYTAKWADRAALDLSTIEISKSDIPSGEAFTLSVRPSGSKEIVSVNYYYYVSSGVFGDEAGMLYPDGSGALSGTCYLAHRNTGECRLGYLMAEDADGCRTYYYDSRYLSNFEIQSDLSAGDCYIVPEG